MLKKIIKFCFFMKNKFKFGFFTKIVNVSFSNSVRKVEPGTRIIGKYKGAITIGDNFYCNSNCHIFGEVLIGDDVMIGPQTIIWSRNHNFTSGSVFNQIGHTDKKITISNNVWIGSNVVILPGVSIGDNTVIAASSVVTKSFNMTNVVIGGNPAKVIKEI